MADPKNQSLMRGLLQIAAQRFATLTGGVWTPTDKPYIPSTFSAPVDGSIYGNNYSSLEVIRQSEELAIALTRIANTVAETEWDICDQDGKPIDGGKRKHPLYDLLKKPNPLCNWSDFVRTMVFMKATGNRYILIDENVLNQPMRLWQLRSDKTRPIRSQEPMAPVQGYEHYAEDGRRYVFPFENVVHQKDPNPFTMYTGLAPTQLLDMTLNMEAASLDYNWRYFLQGGDPSTILLSDKTINAERRAEIIAQFKQHYAGFHNAHRMMLLDDGLKKDTSGNKTGDREVDFRDSGRIMSRKIGGFFGVPPIVMGHVEDANRSNSATQMQLFSTLGVAPELRDLNELLSCIAERFQKGLTFRFRPRPVIDDEVATAQMTAAFQTGALSPNEVRVKYLGMEPVKNDADMDRRYIPINMVPIAVAEDDTRAATAQVTAGEDTNKPVDPAKVPPKVAAPEAKPAEKDMTVKEALAILQAEDAGKAVPRGTQAQRRVLQFLIRQRPKTERHVAPLVSAWFKQVGAAAAAKLEAKGKTAQATGKLKKSLAFGSAVRLAEGDAPDLSQKLTPVYQDQLVNQYDLLAGMFAIDVEYAGTSALDAAVNRLAQRVTNVTADAQAKLDELIRSGVEQGLTPWQIANGTTDGSFAGIRATFDDMASERAMLITRTETGALQDQASVAAYNNMGVTVLDVIGCEDFSKMPGQTYGCNSQGIPIQQALAIDFHPNHRGALVPRLENAQHLAKALALFHVEQA